jgi:ketopantoate reductase
MRPRLAFVGAGAVGGYVGGHLHRLGHDVTLIDPWPEHVEAIRARGLELTGVTEAERAWWRCRPCTSPRCSRSPSSARWTSPSCR